MVGDQGRGDIVLGAAGLIEQQPLTEGVCMSWTSASTALDERTLLLRYSTGDGRVLTWRELISAWRLPEFAQMFSESICATHAGAVRWESPPLRRASLDQQAEFAVVASPGLDRPANKTAFKTALAGDPTTATFVNLRGDATLVAPGEIDPATNYTHLASFLRTASPEQSRSLWAAVADALQERLSNKTVWLSTAGGGVAWLHVRLDDSPKYYSHHPYCA